MKNIGIQWMIDADVDHFTSDFGIRLRRVISRPVRWALRVAAKRKIVVESFPELERGKPYIFASTHSFDEDVVSGLGCLDRGAYLLNGTTNQFQHNPQMYATWLTGNIYVNRMNPESRHSSLPKMERVLKGGTSVYMYPEGGWNNSENLLVYPLFAGVYQLAHNTGIQIVPLCTFCEHDGDTIYFNASSPINAQSRDKDDVLREVRDSMATMVWQSIENHSTPIKRAEMTGDARMQFMRERCREYQRVKWYEDVWEEELTIYRDKRYPTPQMIRNTLKDVKITKENARIVAPIHAEIEEDKKYDFKRFMHENWDKKQTSDGA